MKTANNDIIVETIDEIIVSLKEMANLGWRGFDIEEGTAESIESWGQGTVRNAKTLADVREELGDCTRCGLSQGRQNIVFGSGNPAARLMFVGEGPGYDEDQQGEPFVGKAGQLLTKIIQAMALTRDQVYIANIVKCRPPNNRNPQPAEIETCLPFLKKQMAVIQPEITCALGSISAKTLLNSNAPISKLRGRFHDAGEMKIMPTYHPAYLLRNPGKKRDVWNDVQQIMKALG